jgi:hypothetical protein
MKNKKLPIGIQSFSKLREENCYYVDKTKLILQLIEEGTHYFLSRPRRFGKSLLLDTMAELFEGNRDLFNGLYVEAHWNWERKHPVLRLSFGAGNFKTLQGLEQAMHQQLFRAEKAAGLPAQFPDLGSRFADLLERLHAQSGRRVVVLVDEYDKPILDNITHPDMARDMRDSLRSLYAVIKDQDAHI